ncbi:uncharacterized protein B0I36DRAFT_326774 [Microdochium trichocladiopsis]|uniref:Glycosyltransferase family 1 protein n=1 Tax=Microdochium trichocladiopsis TaxID=1682393 RepID=A0A9P9BN16_9PEZI|nr:uncharacterized protein B0I36DRAFT_326774 [Microdochium trichocladiopsis]KAH7027263.1 hypothetical protein B0I36DRAFT_326774 [Microdochium trichocladiopsis]
MARRSSTGAIVALIAVLLGLWWARSTQSSSTSSSPTAKDLIRGKNNTVLFLTTETHGLCNVHVATAFALAQRHPGTSVNYASFPALAKRIARTSALAAASRTDPQIEDNGSPLITFHALSGASYRDVVTNSTAYSGMSLIHGPGLAGAEGLCRVMDIGINGWQVDDHIAQYHSARAIMDAVDPSIVVVDVLLGPAYAAVRDARRAYAVLSPNTITGHTPAVQPLHTMLWKYSLIASGIPYPMKTPKQLLINLIYTYKMIRCAIAKASQDAQKLSVLQAAGLQSIVDVTAMYDPAAPFITQTLPGAHVDLLVVPDNFVMVGPVNLAGVEELLLVNDGAATLPPLLEWVRRGPTMLINMGSMYEFREPELRVMAAAIDVVLREVPGVQVLWKAKLAKDVVGPESRYFRDDEGLLASLCQEGQQNGRVKVEKWLEVEPPTLVLEENVVAYVHHGGAGAFNDALGAGIPHVVLPMWADLYDYATLVEYLDIGLWGCPETSPVWEVECLSSAFVEVLSGRGNETSSRGSIRRANAARFGEQAKKQVGRDVAAQEIARLASL